MAELSQAERTAMDEAVKADGFGEPARRRAWQAGRDYGRGRERALEGALGRLVAEVELLRRPDADLLGVLEFSMTSALIEADVVRSVDSDGRPLCFECRRPQGEHDGGVECQPDHGPREPSDPKRCTYCGGTFPTPVELHHAEADCCGLGEPSDEMTKAERLALPMGKEGEQGESNG